jgi:pimeloyl-ACP methyl ester carboxylesterase
MTTQTTQTAQPNPTLTIQSTLAVRYDNVPLQVEKIVFSSALDNNLDWAVLTPPPAGHNDWLVFLHGHGSFGDQIYVRKDIRDQWLPHITSKKLGILGANIRGNSWMNPQAAYDLAALIHWLKSEKKARNIILVGGSMGGTSALIFAGLHPELLDAVVALCPASDLSTYVPWCDQRRDQIPILAQLSDTIKERYQGSPSENPDVYAKHNAVANAHKLKMPVTVCQATGDRTIPVEQARAFAQKLSGKMTFRYLELTGGHHDSAIPEFPPCLDWVLVRLGL